MRFFWLLLGFLGDCETGLREKSSIKRRTGRRREPLPKGRAHDKIEVVWEMIYGLSCAGLNGLKIFTMKTERVSGSPHGRKLLQMEKKTSRNMCSSGSRLLDFTKKFI
ncbi:hypothetical protein Zmor_004844 [Zophobas morio]|uniref:Secreted protein n=1 Tax=Zophobas morio TaxID=2755281 RepID=A0AA38ISU5_9CUCU|nr:hypothetical protein Zmor_004844 [Zophobas morio]